MKNKYNLINTLFSYFRIFQKIGLQRVKVVIGYLQISFIYQEIIGKYVHYLNKMRRQLGAVQKFLSDTLCLL